MLLLWVGGKYIRKAYNLQLWRGSDPRAKLIFRGSDPLQGKLVYWYLLGYWFI